MEEVVAMEQPIVEPSDRVILAVDVSDVRRAAELVSKFVGQVGGFKLGLELMMSTLMTLGTGSEQDVIICLEAFRALMSGLEGRIFWDAKFHDIPNTVGAATKAVTGGGRVRWIDVHASGGGAMIQAAASNKGDAMLVAVTVLTSLSNEDCVSIFNGRAPDVIKDFVKMAEHSGVDGIVCSATDVELVKRVAPRLFTIVPGTRPGWASANDQKRIMTPGEAIKAGADYLVIGRAVTEWDDPEWAMQHIVGDIAQAMADR